MTSIDAKVGARIKARRAELGLTQLGLAEMIGASEMQMSRYESGATSVKPELMVTLAKALRVETRYFVEGL